MKNKTLLAALNELSPEQLECEVILYNPNTRKTFSLVECYLSDEFDDPTRTHIEQSTNLDDINGNCPDGGAPILLIKRT